MALDSPQTLVPLQIATNGILAPVEEYGIQSPSLTIATMGWIVILEEEIEEIEEVVTSGGTPETSQQRFKRLKKKKKKKRKKITAWVEVDGVVYKEVAYTSDLNMSLTDVDVDIKLDEDKKPRLKIILPEIKTNE